MSMAIRPPHMNQVPSRRGRRRPAERPGTRFDLLGDFRPHQHRRHLQQAEPLAAPA